MTNVQDLHSPAVRLLQNVIKNHSQDLVRVAVVGQTGNEEDDSWVVYTNDDSFAFNSAAQTLLLDLILNSLSKEELSE